MNERLRQRWWTLPLVAATVGCGGSTDTALVQGAVTHQGQAISYALIQFFPADGGRPTSVAADDRGAYQIRLHPGDYTVTVKKSTRLPEGWREGDPLPPSVVEVPPLYTHRKRSPLRLSVVVGEPIEHDWEL